MRPKTLLLLFLLVAGLAGFIVLVERDLPGTDQRAERAQKVFATAGEASRIIIERGGERLVFERSPKPENTEPENTKSENTEPENDDWRLTEPVAARADSQLVDDFVTGLAELEKERTFEDAEPATLGLDPPRAQVTLESTTDAATLLVGSDVPASESLIVAAGESGPFHVVARAPWADLERSVDAWRVRSIFPGERDEIETVTLVRGERRVSLAAGADGYAIVTPIEDRADEGTMSRFLDALTELEAEEFIDRPPANREFGLETSDRALEITLRSADEPWRLTLGSAVGEDDEGEEGEGPGSVYARADGQIYVVADTLSSAIERPAQQWRSLDWTGLQVHQIERLEVTDGQGSFTLEREGGDWLRDGEVTEYAPVSDLLYDLVGVKARALDAEAAIAGEPLLVLTVNPGPGELLLEVFAAAGDDHPARASDRSTALWLGGDRVRALTAKIAAVRAAEAPVGEASGDSSPVAPKAATDSP